MIIPVMSESKEHNSEMTEEEDNQKRSRRGGVTIPVLVIAKGVKLEHATEALNASPSGIFIKTDKPPEVGTRVEILFTPSGDNDSVRVVGEVVRQTEFPIKGIGVELDRKSTPSDALRQYRALVLHAIRHSPDPKEINDPQEQKTDSPSPEKK